MSHSTDDPAQRSARQTDVFFDTIATYEKRVLLAADETKYLSDELALARDCESELRALLLTRQTEIIELQDRVAALRGSASWRVTKPLRATATLWRRLRLGKPGKRPH